MKKRFGICAITLVIVGLMITSTVVSISHVSQKPVSENQAIVGVPTELTSMDATVSRISCAKPLPSTSPTNTLSLGTDVQVFFDEVDCQNPATVTDAGLEKVLVFTEILRDVYQTNIYGRWSPDGGETWSGDIAGWDEVTPVPGDPDDVSIPKLDYYGEESWAYGTCTAGGLYDGTTYYFELPDIADPDYDPNGYGWVYYSVDWFASHGFSGFDSADVGCFPYDPDVSPNAEFWGCIAGTGDRPPGADEENDTMWFSFFVEGGSVTIISFYNMNTDVEKITCDVDQSLGQFYMAMEYVDEANPADNGTKFVKAPAFQPNENWWQGSYPGYLFDGVYNPDITAADGSVYIVGETIVDDYKDIICLYSTNAGASFSQGSVTSTATDDEMYPSIGISEDDLVCTYIRDGNLYVSVSEDGGVSWVEEAEKVNDPEGSVVEQYGSVGIDGPYGAWTDDRNDPTEIYFDIVIEPPLVPIIDITAISGGLGVSADIKNIGTGDATDVTWTITVTGGFLGFINKIKLDIIPSLAVDATEAVKSGILLGFGKIAITVTAECDEGSSDEESASGTQIIIFSLVS